MFFQVGSGAMVFATQIYNAGKGVASSPMSGESKPMEGDDLATMKEGALIFAEPHYTALGYTSVLLGIEEQKDQKQLYKIQVNKGGERKDIEYYDVETGFKVRVEGKSGTTEYADYKAIDGVFYPYSIKQTMGGQSFNLIVSEIKVNSKLKDDLFLIK